MNILDYNKLVNLGSACSSASADYGKYISEIESMLDTLAVIEEPSIVSARTRIEQLLSDMRTTKTKLYNIGSGLSKYAKNAQAVQNENIANSGQG